MIARKSIERWSSAAGTVCSAGNMKLIETAMNSVRTSGSWKKLASAPEIAIPTVTSTTPIAAPVQKTVERSRSEIEGRCTSPVPSPTSERAMTSPAKISAMPASP